jgi:hypothetical protein
MAGSGIAQTMPMQLISSGRELPLGALTRASMLEG